MDQAAERKPVRVTIYNQSYTLGAAEDAAEVQELAHSIDELMTSIAQRAGNVDAQRIAVLACFHMADRLRTIEGELAGLRGRVSAKAREFTLLLDKAAAAD